MAFCRRPLTFQFHGDRCFATIMKMWTSICVVILFAGLAGTVSTDPTYPGDSSSLEMLSSTSSAPKAQVSEESSKDVSDIRPIDKGLQPLYVITNGFLDVVHPSSKQDWIDDPRFEHVFDNGDLSAGLTIVTESFKNDWQFWASHYIGFTICIVFGMLFVVVMPIVGFCFCCWRMRGRCGARQTKGAKKSDGCNRVVCGVILIIITTLITAGMVCAFVTNELMHQQTSSDRPNNNANDPASLSVDVGFLPTVVASLQRIKAYRNRIFEMLRKNVINAVDQKNSALNKQLTDFPDSARAKLLTLTDSGQVLERASVLATSLKNISNNLEKIQEHMGRLLQLEQQLNDSVMTTKTNILRALPDRCTDVPKCRDLKNQISSLTVTVNFSQGQNLSAQLITVRSVIDNDFVKMIEDGKVQYRNMSNKISNDAAELIRDNVQKFLRDFNPRVKEFLTDANKSIDTLNIETGNNLQFDDLAEELTNEVMPKVKKYGEYRYYVGIALSCVLLLFVICNYLGLCFGACGETAGHGAQMCNRGVGASFLMAGVGLTFVFSWLLMTIVIVLFFIGGGTYTEVCRPVMLQQDKGVIKLGEKILASQLNQSKVTFTIMKLLQNCEANEGIYKTLNLEQAINLTVQFDSLRDLIRGSVDQLSGHTKPNLSNVVIASRDVLDALDTLKSAKLDDIKFAAFEKLLNKSMTSANVSSVADELDELSTNPYVNETQRRILLTESQRLRNTSTTVITPMINISTSLRGVLESLKSDVVPRQGAETFANRTQELIDALFKTQDFIRVNLSGVMSDYIVNFVQNVVNSSMIFINGIQYEIQNNVGRCRVLYDEYKTVSSSVCNSFLSPFNGFWFSVGLCLFFSIPSIIVSIKLVGLYRKTNDHSPSESKSFDDPLTYHTFDVGQQHNKMYGRHL